jgi:type IV pilus biogenesis protein CpaD/CtpE
MDSSCRVAVAIVTAICTGCSQQEPFSKEEKVAARQLSELLPKGTPEHRATKILSDRGFSLSRLSADAAADHLVLASRVVNTTYWQLGIVIVKGKVASTTVKVSDVGADPK